MWKIRLNMFSDGYIFINISRTLLDNYNFFCKYSLAHLREWCMRTTSSVKLATWPCSVSTTDVNDKVTLRTVKGTIAGIRCVICFINNSWEGNTTLCRYNAVYFLPPSPSHKIHPIARPFGPGMEFFCGYKLWFILCLSRWSDVCNSMLHWTASQRQWPVIPLYCKYNEVRGRNH